MNSSAKHGDYTRHPNTNRQVQPSTESTNDPSPSILKIPRIRLKSNKSEKKQSSPSSPPGVDNGGGGSGRNNKFSYIENSHLVNPVMIQQQQVKMSKRKEEQGGSRVNEGGHEFEVDKEGTPIKPKKLPNPIKESVAMQSIHRELLLNQKIGRSVLTHKTELQKALEKLATKNNDSDTDSSSSPAPHPPPMMPLPNDKRRTTSSSSVITSNNNKNEFQRILEQRAKQIEEQKCFVDGVTKAPVINESEFEKLHKRINKNAGGGVMQK